MPKTFYQVIAYYHSKPGCGDAVEATLHELAMASRAESGNIAYAFYRSPENTDHFAILEEYVDEAAFGAHRSSAHFQTIALEKIVPMLETRNVKGFVCSR